MKWVLISTLQVRRLRHREVSHYDTTGLRSESRAPGPARLGSAAHCLPGLSRHHRSSAPRRRFLISVLIGHPAVPSPAPLTITLSRAAESPLEGEVRSCHTVVQSIQGSPCVSDKAEILTRTCGALRDLSISSYSPFLPPRQPASLPAQHTQRHLHLLFQSLCLDHPFSVPTQLLPSPTNEVFPENPT